MVFGETNLIKYLFVYQGITDFCQLFGEWVYNVGKQFYQYFCRPASHEFLSTYNCCISSVGVFVFSCAKRIAP